MRTWGEMDKSDVPEAVGADHGENRHDVSGRWFEVFFVLGTAEKTT